MKRRQARRSWIVGIALAMFTLAAQAQLVFKNSFETGEAVVPPHWVAGYYVGYERDLYPVADIQFDAITHLMVGRAIPVADGTLLTHFDIDAVNGPIWAQAAVDAAHAAQRKAVLMVGGAGEINGWRGAASDAHRATFVASLLGVVDAYGFDGLDLDWEPIEADDHAPLIALAQALRAARPNLLLTIPVGPVNANFSDPADEKALFTALSPLLDQFNLMSYGMGFDYPGWHSWFSSPLDGHAGNTPTSVAHSIGYYRATGIPAAKLGVGIGFYGTCYQRISQPRVALQGGDIVASDGAMSYRNIAGTYLPAMTRQYDAIANAPWLGSAQGQGPQACTYVSYEDAQSIAAKGAWVQAQGLGGTIIWTISQGHVPSLPAGDRDPLLDAVRDAFLGTVAPPPEPVATLQVEHDVSVDGMNSDRFSWRDSANQPRVAVLAHNTGQFGPSGTRGGELREFRYQVGGIPRVVRAMTNGFGGFGYVVSHPGGDVNQCTGGGDSSSLGHFATGSFTRVFEGRHHALFRFTQNYPRYCTIDAPATQFNLPVTIEWLFATGRDAPLWSVTYEIPPAATNRLRDDARGPYGEMMIDGAASAAARSFIAGVGWGDHYKFTTTTAPVTLASEWTWNQANTIPYVKLWTTAVDATMGTVATRPITQQDAGGYWGISDWNKTSATANTGCVGQYNMPCDYNWPYQSVNYELYGGATQNARLAWGTNFGFLGQSQYKINGSNEYGGPFPDAYAPGVPKKSYSTHIVFGRHSDAVVEAQVSAVEALQQMTLTAAVGSVVTQGAAGVGDATPTSYTPAGHDHVRGALALTAAANQLDANIGVAPGFNLARPLIIVRGYGAGADPQSVRLGDSTLVADADYFLSRRAAAQELWITLNRTLVGSVNRLRIDP